MNDSLKAIVGLMHLLVLIFLVFIVPILMIMYHDSFFFVDPETHFITFLKPVTIFCSVIAVFVLCASLGLLLLDFQIDRGEVFISSLRAIIIAMIICYLPTITEKVYNTFMV